MARPKDIDTEAGRVKHAAKTQRILEAAKTVFLEQGIEHAKISVIARKACVADGTIYLYFENLRGLIKAVVAQNPELLVEFIKKDYAELLDGRSVVIIPANTIELNGE